jgi:hypothetical protein
MTLSHRRVLVVPGNRDRESELMRVVMPPLVRLGCITDRAAEGYAATQVLEQIRFALVVVAAPIEEPPLTALIKSMRWKEAACRRTPLLVVSWPEGLWAAEEFLNRGVNRVIRHDTPHWEVDKVVEDLLAVEPRVKYSTVIKLQVPHAGRVESKMAQLDNLSTSGMLIRGPDHVQVGAPLPFEMPLSGDPTPIRGLAEVVRSTTREREGVTGFAARFVQIDDDGALRLERFVARNMAHQISKA